MEKELLNKEQLLNDAVLRRLWERAVLNIEDAVSPDEWNDQLNLIYKSGKVWKKR